MAAVKVDQAYLGAVEKARGLLDGLLEEVGAPKCLMGRRSAKLRKGGHGGRLWARPARLPKPAQPGIPSPPGLAQPPSARHALHLSCK